jgi:hypothetical protein
LVAVYNTWALNRLREMIVKERGSVEEIVEEDN